LARLGLAFFSLIQILFAWSDIEAADKAKHAFPNLVGAVITAVLGKLLNDPLSYAFSVAVIAIIFLKWFEKI